MHFKHNEGDVFDTLVKNIKDQTGVPPLRFYDDLANLWDTVSVTEREQAAPTFLNVAKNAPHKMWVNFQSLTEFFPGIPLQERNSDFFDMLGVLRSSDGILHSDLQSIRLLRIKTLDNVVESSFYKTLKKFCSYAFDQIGAVLEELNDRLTSKYDADAPIGIPYKPTKTDTTKEMQFAIFAVDQKVEDFPIDQNLTPAEQTIVVRHNRRNALLEYFELPFQPLISRPPQPGPGSSIGPSS